MAHLRKPLARALVLNTAVLTVETVGSLEANSLSLAMDAIHNLSDEMGLAFLLLAYTLRAGLSSHFLRSANVFNSFGLLVVSGFLVWQTIERFLHPEPVLGLIPIAAGLLAAAGNWGVARALRDPSREDVAIRLAYVHNVGDTLVSLAPVAAGLAILMSGLSLFDTVIALMIAVIILTSTLQAVIGSHKELLWPETVVCGHRGEQYMGEHT